MRKSIYDRRFYIVSVFVLQKLSCVLQSSAILGLSRCINSSSPTGAFDARSVITWPEYISSRPKMSVFPPSKTIYHSDKLIEICCKHIFISRNETFYLSLIPTGLFQLILRKFFLSVDD